MAEDFRSLMTVKIEPHVEHTKQMTPLGMVDAEVEYDQYRVWVYGERIQTTTKSLLVGYIGKQPGANFCPIGGFYKFPTSMGKWIAEQAKELHGNATQDEHVDVPPPNMPHNG